MSASFTAEDKLVRYLLGRMPEQERLELEERLFTDEELDEQLLATTDDLIRAYLAGELSETDRAGFEAHFLASPGNREHVDLMRDVLHVVERSSTRTSGVAKTRPPAAAPRPAYWALAATAAVLLMAVILVVAARRGRRTERQATASPRPAVSAMGSTETTRPSSSPTPAVGEPADVPVIRLAGTARTPARVRLSANTRAVRLEVAVDQESPSFDVAILAANGKAIWRAEARPAPASGEPLALEVPAKAFDSGGYRLRVEGERLREATPPVLEYRLEVVRTAAPLVASPR